LRTLFSSTFLADSTTGLLLLPPISTTTSNYREVSTL
jgi:hypothetical protein